MLFVTFLLELPFRIIFRIGPTEYSTLTSNDLPHKWARKTDATQFCGIGPLHGYIIIQNGMQTKTKFWDKDQSLARGFPRIKKKDWCSWQVHFQIGFKIWFHLKDEYWCFIGLELANILTLKHCSLSSLKIHSEEWSMWLPVCLLRGSTKYAPYVNSI